MKKLTVIALMSTLGVSTLGFAGPSDLPSYNEHAGWYVEANAGTNLALVAISASDTKVTEYGYEGFGYNINAGYNWRPGRAIELGFMQNYVTYVDNNNVRQSDYVNIPYTAVRFTLPMMQRGAFIAKVGVMGFDDPKHKEYLLLPYTGFGFSYAVTHKVDISAQYQGAIYGIVNAGLLSAGITYHI